MKIQNTKDAYGVIAKFFHWAMAFIILGLILVGLYMESLPYGPDKVQIILLHKSFGLLILWLVVLRFLWRVRSLKPEGLATHKRWEKQLSFITHTLLYVLMLALPLSGWIMSSAAQYPVPFFGWSMPDIVPPNKILAGIANNLHSIFAFTLIGLIFLHVAGAFKHHIIDKDITLTRMVWGPLEKFGPYILMLVMALFFTIVAYLVLSPESENPVSISEIETGQLQNEEPLATSVTSEKNHWKIVKSESSIGFKGSIYGSEFQGQFQNFDGEIIFDPAKPETSSVVINIYSDSIETGDDERDFQLQTADWFSSDTYPSAVFTSVSFEKMDAENFIVKGMLTIKDIHRPIEFPFHLAIDGDRAVMTSDFIINRLSYNLGAEQWSSGNNVAIDAPVALKIVAELVSTEN